MLTSGGVVSTVNVTDVELIFPTVSLAQRIRTDSLLSRAVKVVLPVKVVLVPLYWYQVVCKLASDEA